MGSLKKQTVSGFKWVFAFSISQKFLSFCTSVVLARILMPADFGLFALAFVLIDGFGLFKNLGIGQALIQRKDEVEEASDTAFIILPLVGFLLFVLLYALAPFGAQLLGNTTITSLVRILGFIFVISCFSQVPGSLLNKNLQFKEKAISEICATISYSFVSIFLAINKFGVWSLVYGYIVKTVVQTAMFWFYAKWRPHFRFSKKIAVQMLNFGKFLLAGNILSFLRGNLDNVFVGKMLGVTMLGYYALAFNISTFLNDYIIDRFSTVLFPAYSKIQDDTDDLKTAYLKVLKYILIISVPFVLILFLLAPEFLKIVYGDKWLPAISVLRILCFAGLIKAVSGTTNPIFLAKGRTKTDFYLTLIPTSLFFILLWPMTSLLKIEGAALAVLISSFIAMIFSFIRIKRIFIVNFRELFISVKYPLLSSLLMLLGIAGVKLSLENNNFIYPSKIYLLAYFLIGSFIYLASFFIFNRKLFREIKNLIFYNA